MRDRSARLSAGGGKIGPDEREAKRAIFDRVQKTLISAIRESQEACWSHLCEQVDSDPWGLPYRTVVKGLGRANPGAAASERESELAIELFPSSPFVDWNTGPLPTPLFTEVELTAATLRLPSGKAPGPRGIQNEALVVLCSKHPDVPLAVFNECLAAGTFPDVWKTA